MSSPSSTGYTLVSPEGSPNYLAPRESACPESRRYMAVHRVVRGGWGIVDRRTGRLLAEARPDQHRYAGWQEVQAAVRRLNGPASG
jgi:hypothetical protein